MKKTWLAVGFLAAYFAAFAVNIGSFTWGYSCGFPQIVTSALYLMIWVGCFVIGRRNASLRQRLLWLPGAVTAAAGVLGLLVRGMGWGLLTLPALLAAGFSVTPLYGILSLPGDFDLLYLLAALLGGVMCALCLWPRKRESREEGM